MTDYDSYDGILPVVTLTRIIPLMLGSILAWLVLPTVFRQLARLVRWLRVPRIRMGGLSWSREDFTAGWLITGGTGTGKTLSGFTRLLYETFRCEKDWGGIVIDDKGHFHQTVLAMAPHVGREQDVILLRPGESPEVKPAHRFNLTGNRDIPYLTYARMVVDIGTLDD